MGCEEIQRTGEMNKKEGEGMGESGVGGDESMKEEGGVGEE